MAMKSIRTVTTAAIVQFLCGYFGTSMGEKTVFNVDQHFDAYTKDMASKHNTKVSWIDCWFNSSHMTQHRVYSPYKLTLQFGRFNMGPDAETTTRQPSVVYRHKYVNRQTTPIEAWIDKTKQREEVSEVTTTKGFECNITASLTATIKGVVDIGGGVSINMLLHKTRTETTVTEKTIQIQMKVVIPPMTEVTVEWHMTDIQKKYKWTMEMFVSGYCAVWFHNKVKNEHLHFIAVKEFATWNTKALTLISGGKARYVNEGEMTLASVTESNVYVTETKIGRGRRRRTTTCRSTTPGG